MPTSYPSLLEPHFAETFNLWKTNPGPQTAGKLLHSVEPVINEAMRSYASQSTSSPTLKSKARQLTLDAFESYDPARAKLRTHLLSRLQGLRRLGTQETQLLHVPEQLLLDHGHLRQSENQLKETLGRDPSAQELSDHVGLSMRRIQKIRTMQPAKAESSLAAHQESPGRFAPAVTGSSEKAQQAWQEFIYQDLEPTDQIILEHTLGLHGKPSISNQEIAKKLKVSPGAVSQRKEKIQNKLDMASSTGLFQG